MTSSVPTKPLLGPVLEPTVGGDRRGSVGGGDELDDGQRVSVPVDVVGEDVDTVDRIPGEHDVVVVGDGPVVHGEDRDEHRCRRGRACLVDDRVRDLDRSVVVRGGT